jgi:cation transporter-like permease
MEYRNTPIKQISKHLKKILPLHRKKHHPEVHKIHKKYGISKQTLFYIKEYGKNANVSKTIIKESIKILLLASFISSLGGLALEQVRTLFLSILPLIILLPTLNNMIGNYGTIISSRFSTMLYEGEIKSKWWKNLDLKKLFVQIGIMVLIGAVLSSAIAIGITYFSPGGISFATALKVFLIVVIDMLLLTNILFFVAIFAGIYIYKKKEDPNNFLIPITTSVADFANMAVLALLIILLF